MKKQTQELKILAKSFFKKNKSVCCPAFPKEQVALNSKALSHLFYKGANKKSGRPIKEIETRVNLLPTALKVLTLMPLAQEENTLVNKEGKVCVYWAFEAVVDKRRIKVIVRQVGKGKKHFWSVIPAWRRIRETIINAKGNLANE